MSKIGKEFKDIEYYNRQMSLGMKDKLFFVDILSGDTSYTFVDFGCADGSLINELYGIFGSSCRYIGYDISEQMISFAKSKFCGDPSRALFTSKWEEVVREMLPYENTVLILSSVIHEVYSYGSDEDIRVFWYRVLNSKFSYIVVRDMMLSSASVTRQPDANYVHSVISKEKYNSQVLDFEKVWGILENNNKNLIHFLLKYRWKINWDRELHENYFPIVIEEFLQRVEAGEYRLDYFEKFRIKFIEDQIKRDFDIQLQDTTHIKAIFINENIDIPF